MLYRDLVAEFKELGLFGMAQAMQDIIDAEQSSGDWTRHYLAEALLHNEFEYRRDKSVARLLKAAKFPILYDLEGFDFKISPVDHKLVRNLSNLAFTAKAQNLIILGGPGTGKSHLATALGVSGIRNHYKRVRWYSMYDLVLALQQELFERQEGRIVAKMLRMDAVILDNLGLIPYINLGEALICNLLNRLYKRTSVIITADRPLAQWSDMFSCDEITTAALLDRVTDDCIVLKTGDKSYRRSIRIA